MNTRNACFAGLAAAVTLLAGCAAQYRNISTCEEAMRSRLAETTLGDLKVTHSATTYRGARVVIEGQLEHGAASAAAAASAPSASAASAASAASSATAQGANEATTFTAPTVQAAALPGTISVPIAPVAEGGAPEGEPTTPVAALVAKLGIKKAVVAPAAAECTFNESGLATFRWLAPPKLAKTTPDPNAAND
ncbi:hypothetical protein M3I53_23240 [Paraburkholderia sp. CNPSo 3272]|uniref:hypothetical protein n=1 Tax=Paraburkholderia sp. CNPSo 3272 TaxID=2940931 RepID=UPI0020B8ACFB|nr:hypothetical protein [Paraburkholderia sp. CNPSo 3272]MCP3726007.1 hypothetical protein [Paraburkholderia sp. CNPSo 3272]